MAVADHAKLLELLEEVRVDDEALRKMLGDLAGDDPKGGHTDPDEVPPLGKKSSIRTGEMFALGDHRLMCGDAFNVEHRERLFQGEVGLVLTDPPYAIYGSSTGVASDVADDAMVRPFFESLFRVIAESLPWFGHAYVHCDWRSWATVWHGAKIGGMTAKNCLVWDKGGSGLGNNYANTHEFIGFFAKIPEQQGMTKHTAGQRPVLAPNILRFARPTGDERQHNAAKPVALLSELIGNSSIPEDVVLDPFMGSGSTIIAAEQTGRRAYGMDIDPRYVAVAIERWENFTGQKAAKVG